MIKVVICDGEGSVGLPDPSDQMRNLLYGLSDLGVELAVATNRQSERGIRIRFQRAGLPVPNYVATKKRLGVSKPSPQFVDYIAELAGAHLSEMVYLGDNDITDIFCALNAGVLPFAAEYANPNIKYGIKVSDPKGLFDDYLRTFGQQEEPYFGWRYYGWCHQTGTPVESYALLGSHKATGLTDDLKAVLKEHETRLVGPNQVSLNIMLYQFLVSQLFLSGLRKDIDLITVYPGHSAGSHNTLLQDFSEHLAKLVKKDTIRNLLVRHTTAPQSRRSSKRRIFDQFRTIIVNPEYAQKINGRTVLVVDDFTTSGNSLETARRMLLQAGAGRVVMMAIGKYRIKCRVTEISKNWNAFKPCTLSEDDIGWQSGRGQLRPSVDEYFATRILPVYAGS